MSNTISEPRSAPTQESTFAYRHELSPYHGREPRAVTFSIGEDLGEYESWETEKAIAIATGAGLAT